MQTDNQQNFGRPEQVIQTRAGLAELRQLVPPDSRIVARVIRKYYNRLDQAERYQNWLYGRHDNVKLTESPRFSEGGFYAWTVQ